MKKIYLPDFERYIDEDVLIGKIATYIFVNTTTNTNYGSWCTDSEELGEVFPEEGSLPSPGSAGYTRAIEDDE